MLQPFRKVQINMTPARLSFRKWNRLVAMAALLASLFVATKVPGQTRGYIVRQLSSDDAAAVPCKLNNLGDIVGRANNQQKGESQATVWNRSNFKSKHFAALVGGDYSSAFGINDMGEVAGGSNTGSAIVPFIWTTTGGLGRIPLLRGDSGGLAMAINTLGHVVGYSSGPNGRRAFLWTRNGSPHDLGILPGGNYSSASAINDSDEVAGKSNSLAGDRAVMWTKTGYARDLGTLPGDSSSEANAINNHGDVVGYSKGPQGMHAFLWTQAAGMQDLGVLPGGSSSQAFSINDSGDVVGSSTSSEGDRAFIWTKQGGMRDLNSAVPVNFGAVFVEAHAINARGQILAMGQSSGGSTMNDAMSSEHHEICAPAPPSSFLLTPVSTP
jgi:probable HAF family extracellular repeat protein